MLFDYPETAKFLTDEERHFVVTRLKLDNDGCSQAFKYKFIKDAFLDWKVWMVRTVTVVAPFRTIAYDVAHDSSPSCSREL